MNKLEQAAFRALILANTIRREVKESGEATSERVEMLALAVEQLSEIVLRLGKIQGAHSTLLNTTEGEKALGMMRQSITSANMHPERAKQQAEMMQGYIETEPPDAPNPDT